MATELATAYVQIMPSAKGMKSALENELGGAGESAGASAGSKIGAALKKALVAAGIGTVIKQALGEGMDLQQNLGGTEAVFGEFADAIQEKATGAYKNMGMSASEYMATANKMGALFQGSGIEQQKSLDLTAQAMQRAADVASVMGLDTSAAMESIAGAAKGNFTMMDNLGVAMNATTLQAYALEKGINFDWNTADNAAKAELAMQMFFERTEQYAGNFARESSETLSGSMNAVKAAFSDVLGNMTLGNDIAPSLEALKSTIVTFVSGNLLPALVNVVGSALPVIVSLVVAIGPDLINAGVQAIQSLATGLASALPTLIPQATAAVTSIVTGLLDNIPSLIEAALALVTGLADGILQAIPVLIAAVPQIITSLITAITGSIPQIIQAGVQLLTSLVTNLPQIVSAIVAAIPQIVNGLVSAITGSIPQLIQAGVQLLTALITNLPTIIVTVVTSIPQIVGSLVSAIVGNIPQIVQAGVQLLTALITNLPTIIAKLVGAVPQIISSLVSSFGGFVGKFVEVGKNLLLGLGQGIANAVGSVVAKAKAVAQNIWSSVKSFFGINSPSKLFRDTIGKNLVLGLAGGLTDNAKVAVSAAEDMSAQLADVDYALATDTLTGGISDITRAASGTLHPGLYAAAAAGSPASGQTADGLLAQLLTAVLALSDKLDKIGVYLDSDALVGHLIAKIDAALGRRQVLDARGGAG